MKNIPFEEANTKIAEFQEEYQTLHAYHDAEAGTMLMCFKLDEKEQARAYATGEIFIKLWTFNKPMQPIAMSCNKEELL